jgi:hypothetical protein
MNWQIESEKLTDIKEIGIILTAKTLNPSVLNQDFIHFSGIIPSHWQLASQPIFNPNYAQISFSNGLNLITQANSINFIQSTQGKSLQELSLGEIAHRFIEKIPFAEYQYCKIQIKSLTLFDKNAESVREYITKTFLAAGSWQELGKAPVEASVSLLFQLDRRELSLSINEARIQYNNNTEQPPMSGIFFTGAFNYPLHSEPQTRLKELKQILKNWQQDTIEFHEIVNNHFLKQHNQQQELFLFPSNSI